MNPLRVRVQLFGAFRKYAAGGDVSFDVPRGTTVAALRGHLIEALRRECPTFTGAELVRASALASEDEILDESAQLGSGVDQVSLAVLPPVCGG